MGRESLLWIGGVVLVGALVAVLLWPDAPVDAVLDTVAAPAADGPVAADMPLEPGAASRPAALVPEAIEPPPVEPPASPAADDIDDGTSLVELSVRGRLVDVNGRPLPGALVRLHASMRMRGRLELPRHYFRDDVPWSAFPSALSADDGRFEVSGRELLVEGAARTSASFSSRSVLVATLGGYRPRGLVVTIDGSPVVDLGDIVLEPGAVLTGRVVDPLGAPLADARVVVPRMGRRDQAWGNEDEWELLRDLMDARTREDGRFRLDTHWPGAYRLRIQRRGYQPWEDVVTIRADQPHDLGDVVLEPGHALSGLVLDTRGEPVPGAAVKLRPRNITSRWGGTDTALRDARVVTRSSGGAQEQDVVTDEAGRFAVDDLPDEPYDVIVTKDGYEPQAVREHAVDAELEFVLPDEALLVLRVVDDATGAPLEGASAKVRRCSAEVDGHMSDMDPYLEVLSGREAAERLGLDGDGAGLVVASPAGFVRHTLSVEAETHAAATLELGGVAAGERLEHTVRLQPGARLAGRVLGGDGAPVEGAQVDVELPVDGQPEYQWPDERVQTDAEGAFVFDGLTSGTWRLTAAAPGYVESEPRELELDAARPLADVDVALEPAAVIDGLLLDADGAAAAGWRVDADDARDVLGTYHERTTCDNDGRFRFDTLPAGAVHLYADPGADLDLELVAGQVHEVTLRLQRPPRARGRVVDAAGRPVAADVQAFCWDDFDWPDYEVQADAHGEFAFEGLEPGSAVFVASRDGLRGPPVARELDWGGEVIVDLRLAGGVLGVRVLHDATDEPLADVGLHVRGPSEPPADVPDPGRVSGRTDGDGRAEWTGFASGPWAVLLSGSDWVPASGEELSVDVVDGERSECTLRVAPGAVLSGHVSAAREVTAENLHLALTPLDGQGGRTRAGLPNAGEYTVAGLRTGRYAYEVRRNTSFPRPPDQEHVFARGEFAVVQGETTRHDIVLVPADG